MRLNEQGLLDRAEWEGKGYALPEYDREAVKAATYENPFWIHFGAGNIFRAFQANVVQNLLNEGALDRGLVVAEGFDYEIIEKMNRPHDDYGILVTLKADGSVAKTVVGSVVESHILDSENDAEFGRLKEIFEKDNKKLKITVYSVKSDSEDKISEITYDRYIEESTSYSSGKLYSKTLYENNKPTKKTKISLYGGFL